jgi:hypothetical protein
MFSALSVQERVIHPDGIPPHAIAIVVAPELEYAHSREKLTGPQVLSNPVVVQSIQPVLLPLFEHPVYRLVVIALVGHRFLRSVRQLSV